MYHFCTASDKGGILERWPCQAMPPLPSQETHQALVRDGIINGEHSTVPSATWRGLCGGWTKMDQDGNQLYWAKGRIVFAHFDAFHILRHSFIVEEPRVEQPWLYIYIICFLQIFK